MGEIARSQNLLKYFNGRNYENPLFYAADLQRFSRFTGDKADAKIDEIIKGLPNEYKDYGKVRELALKYVRRMDFDRYARRADCRYDEDMAIGEILKKWARIDFLKVIQKIVNNYELGEEIKALEEEVQEDINYYRQKYYPKQKSSTNFLNQEHPINNRAHHLGRENRRVNGILKGNTPRRAVFDHATKYFRHG